MSEHEKPDAEHPAIRAVDVEEQAQTWDHMAALQEKGLVRELARIRDELEDDELGRAYELSSIAVGRMYRKAASTLRAVNVDLARAEARVAALEAALVAAFEVVGEFKRVADAAATATLRIAGSVAPLGVDAKKVRALLSTRGRREPDADV